MPSKFDVGLIGDRMKAYEKATRITLPWRTYTILRVDGRAFRTYLSSAERPFDMGFTRDMNVVAETLCKQAAGTRFAYAQSDEISLLLTDFETVKTEPWFGGQVQKIVSVAAATAAMTLQRVRGGSPTFDARVFTLPDPSEVINYFLWRQRDCLRNSTVMVARCHFSARQIHGLNARQMREKLMQEAGVDWHGFPAAALRGRLFIKESGIVPTKYVDRRTQEEHETEVERTWWTSTPAPRFTGLHECPLHELIPKQEVNSVNDHQSGDDQADS